MACDLGQLLAMEHSDCLTKEQFHVTVCELKQLSDQLSDDDEALQLLDQGALNAAGYNTTTH